MSYEEWLKSCSSYLDVCDWLEKNFKYDYKRLYESRNRVLLGLPRVRSRSPEETFLLKSGICYDSSVFSKVSLNKINPNYFAEIVYILVEKDVYSHVVCGFFLNSSLYIIDYGTTCEKTKGLSGPFFSLRDYVFNFFLKNHDLFKSVQDFFFGWPEWRSFETF